MLDIEPKKLQLSVQQSDDTIVISVEGEVVRNLSSPNPGGVYKFNYDHEEHHVIYEEVGQGEGEQRMLFFYPLNAFENRIINLDEEEEE